MRRLVLWILPCFGMSACAHLPGELVVQQDLLTLAQEQAEAPPGPPRMLYQSEHQTVFLVTPREPIPRHVHHHSEETVFVLQGQGILHIPGGDRVVKAGDFMVLPRNTPHGFTPTGDEPVAALSSFSPRFRDGDRVAVE